MTSTKKFEGIEALRGLAVLMTVFAHLPLMTAPFIGTGIVSFWHMGVPIFFGISGWIIAHVTKSYSRQNVSEFLLKRLFRILPVLMVTSLLSVLLSVTLPNSEIVRQFYPDIAATMRVVASNFLFISDFSAFLGIVVPLSLLGLWSIAVEVKFYLLFAFIMLFQPGLRLSFLLLSLLIALYTRFTLIEHGNSLGFNNVFFIEAMLAGAISYQFNLSSVLGRVGGGISAVLIAACLIYIFVFPSIAHGGMIWLACYFLLIVAVIILVNVAASLHSTPQSIILSILIFLGARSYSLYVLHFQFISWGGVIGQMNGINFSDPLLYDAILVSSIVFCLPVLELIHQCVELPCVRLAHHLAEKMHART